MSDIDFNTLKYNLYKILNLPSDASEQKIKKTFAKMIKMFHPDKNSELEEDIYCHLIWTSKILLNKGLREKYDEFLKEKIDNFHDLKSDFNKYRENEVTPEFTPEVEKSFHVKINELNQKHNYIQENNNVPTLSFEEYKNKRDSDQIKITKEDIKNNDDFNARFLNGIKEGKFSDQIIEYNESNELTTFSGDKLSYSSLGDISKLYVEDTIISDNYSSLDKAFGIQSISNTYDNLSIEDRMKKYNNLTQEYKKLAVNKNVDLSFKKK